MDTQRSFEERLNTWVQTIAILAAGAWAVYTFIYKEVSVPAATPANLSADVTLSVGGSLATLANGPREAFVPVTLRIVASNPSSRQIELLPSMFIVYGKTLASNTTGVVAPDDVYAFKSGGATVLERHSAVVSSVIVAAGPALPDDFLKPGESTSKTIVIHVPVGQYDILEAVAAIPSTRDPGIFAIKWSYERKSDALKSQMFRIVDGKEEPVTSSERTRLKDDEVQVTAARYQISVVP